MKNALESLKTGTALEMRSSVDLIHKTLYSFSNNNLHTLMRSNAAFRFVLADCIARKEQIFSTFYDKEENEDSDIECLDQSPAKNKSSAVGEL